MRIGVDLPGPITANSRVSDSGCAGCLLFVVGVLALGVLVGAGIMAAGWVARHWVPVAVVAAVVFVPAAIGWVRRRRS